MKNMMSWMKAMRLGDPHPIAYSRSPAAGKLQKLGRELAANPAMSEKDVAEQTMQLVLREVAASVSNEGLRHDPFWLDTAVLSAMGNMGFAEEYVHHIAYGGQVFEFSERLAEMLSVSDTMQIPTDMLRLPYDCFYVGFKVPVRIPAFRDEQEQTLSGVYVRKTGPDCISLMLVGMPEKCSPNVPPSFRWFYANPSLTNAPINMVLTNGLTLGDCIEATVEDYAMRVLDGLESLKEEHRSFDDPRGLHRFAAEKTSVMQDRLRERFVSGELQQAIRHTVNLVANILCFLTSYRESGRTGWTATTPPVEAARVDKIKGDQKRAKAEKEMAWAGYRKLVMFRAPDEDENGNVMTRMGSSPISHWRKGHWRGVRYGVGRMMKRLRWFLPMMVNRDRGVIEIGHRYQVDEELTEAA